MIYVNGASPAHGGVFGAAPVDQSIEARVRKFCKDYKLPEADCTGLIRCAKERSWSLCVKEIAAAVAAGTCAVYVSPYIAPACSAVVRWIADQFAAAGIITQPGCHMAPLRDLPTGLRSADIQKVLAELNPGEYAQIWGARITARPMYFVGCDQEQLDAGIEPVKDVAFYQQVMSMPLGRVPRKYISAGRYETNVIALKDWDDPPGEWQVIDNVLVPVEAPFLFQPLAVQYKPYVPPTPPTDYPVSSFAVFDNAINKYRILAPT